MALQSYKAQYLGYSKCGKSHTNFGILLSMHARVIIWSCACADFLCDLDVGACIF